MSGMHSFRFFVYILSLFFRFFVYILSFVLRGSVCLFVQALTALNQKITDLEVTDATMSEITRLFLHAHGEKTVRDERNFLHLLLLGSWGHVVQLVRALLL